jgi:hypothetical protein
MDRPVLLYLYVLAGIGVCIYLALAAYVAWQASKRGYSFFLWFFAAICSSNPILILIVLTLLPDAYRRSLRSKEMEALNEQLAARPRAGVPHADRPVAPLSLGDQPTAAPPVRSVGDEETRAP